MNNSEMNINIAGKMVKKIENDIVDRENKCHVFIIGSKGIPANYGGFETFVEKLTEYRKSEQIQYHVARMGNECERYLYNNAECFNISVPNIGASKAIYYDIAAMKYCINYCKKRRNIKNPIFYVLACRIGPVIKWYKREIEKLGGVLYINPDGHEWKRKKWNTFIRAYWKWSERLMVKHADLLVCDSMNIEKYIKAEYKKYDPRTTFIAYGCDTRPSSLQDDDKIYKDWLRERDLKEKEYYLVVGRFVAENNYEVMIREFMKSGTTKDFALITNVSNKFLNQLKRKTKFDSDTRIKFVGTVYNQELLKKIRENAYGYFHGHEVGGTNPSLLEALGSTNLNLLLDVGFNKEVAGEAALYWSKNEGDLASIIKKADSLTDDRIEVIGCKARERVRTAYSWDYIVSLYEKIFI